MAVTRIYSSLNFLIAAGVAILLGFCPKFGALIATIPGGVLGGLAVVLFGLIAVTGGRIWVENRVDFSKSRNLVTAAVALTVGAGMISVRDVSFGLTIGGFTIGGIGVATFGSIIMYQLLRERTPSPKKRLPLIWRSDRSLSQRRERESKKLLCLLVSLKLSKAPL